jgi:hypothetical protein
VELQTIGRYQLLSEIARGGMATVYLARDPRFEREVAIKVLPRIFMDDATFRARFSREAKLFAALDHPAIVPVYDFGEENGQPYLVMRLMKGGALADKIKQGPMDLLETLRVLRRIASALDHAHDQGIVHRDIKPSNVLFDQYQDAFLSDFGISRQPDSELTQTGVMSIGTPGYMSPEQIEGNQVDRRSDVYSLGILCYEMIAGKRMYKANTPTMMVVKQMTQPPPLLGEVDLELAKYQPVIDHALAKDPTQRFGKASEFVEALAPLAPLSQATIIGAPPIRISPPAPAPQEPSPAPGEEAQKVPIAVASTETVIEMAPAAPASEPLVSPVEPVEDELAPVESAQEPVEAIVTTPIEPPSEELKPAELTQEPLEEPAIVPSDLPKEEPKPETQEPAAWNVMATVVSARPAELEELLKKAASKPVEEAPSPLPEPAPADEVATQVDMAPLIIPETSIEEPKTIVGESAPTPIVEESSPVVEELAPTEEPGSPYEVATQVDMEPISIPRPSFDEPATFVGEKAPPPPVEPASPFEASTQVDMEPISIPKPSFDEPATFVGEQALAPPVEPVSPFEASTQVDMEPISIPKPSFDEPVTFVVEQAPAPPVEPVSPFEASTQVDMAPIAVPEKPVSPFEAATQVDMEPIVPGKEGIVETTPKVEEKKKIKAAKPSREKARTGRKVHPVVIVGVIGLVMLVVVGALFWLFGGGYVSSSNCLVDPGGGLLVVKSPYSGSVHIDGRISSPLEWSRAYCADMKLLELMEGPFSRVVRWWIQNDENNLYVLVRVPKEVPVRGMFVDYFWPRYENGRWERSDGLNVNIEGLFDDIYGWDETQWFSDGSANPPGMNNVEGAAHEDSLYWWFEAKKALDSREIYDWSWHTGMRVGTTDFDHLLVGIWTAKTGFSRYLQLHISMKP